MCNFRVGQKVVCIDDDWDGAKHPDLVMGRIYTVARVGDDWMGGRTGPYRDYTSIYTREIPKRWVCHPDGSKTDGAFAYTRFRPVTSKRTDISIFQDMLKTNSLELVQ